MTLDEIAAAIYQRRERLGLSRPQVEQLCGGRASWHTLKRIEDGNHIQTATLMTMLDALGLELVVQERKP